MVLSKQTEMELSGSFGCVVELTCGMRLTGPEIVVPQLDHNLTSRFCQFCRNYLSSSAELHPFAGKLWSASAFVTKREKKKLFRGLGVMRRLKIFTTR
jgi:hypothetical protein